MLITKPTHNKFILRDLNESKYIKCAESYSFAKRRGIRSIYAWSTGMGICGVVNDAVKGTFVQYGKEKLALVCINSAVWFTTPCVAVLTNTSKVLKRIKQAHSISAFIFECFEDGGNVMLLPFDMAIFGQPIPVGDKNRFNILSNSTDFFNIND